MWNVAICDDNEQFCSHLESIFELYCKWHSLHFNIVIYQSGEELYHHMVNEGQVHSYQIIFLDIVIGKINGIEISNLIRNSLHNEIVQIVYISAHVNYAMDLFQFHPYDFIVKPFAASRIYDILDKCMHIPSVPAKVFYFQFNKVNLGIAHSHILYFESTYNKKIILTHTGGEYIFYNTLNNIDKDLQNSCFYRIHRGFIINLQYIKYVKGSSVTMTNNYEIPIPHRQQKNTIEYLKKIGGIHNDESSLS